ncbi:MAG: DNA mismatch repair protein MutS [Bacteroidetes bacterium]|nr:DNA mismatch repair protein MutS [Bacteroidota bacterium]MBP6315546.1 DNA mismatch repair protein MutS [Chitinophagaceae bacterium]
MNIFPSELPSLLGFDAIIARLATFCVGKNAKEAAQQLLPSSNYEKVATQLQEIVEYMNASAGSSIISQSHYPEIEKELNVLRMQDAVLTAIQCKQLRKLISLSNELIHFFADKMDLFPTLSQKIAPNEEDKTVLGYIDEVLDKDGIVKDDASESLKQIRLELIENRKVSDRLYRAHIQRLRKAGQLAEIEEYFVNGRRVLGILAEYKRTVKGLILGQSASGKITYIEPQNMIELNNDRLQLEDDEQKEIYKILKLTTDCIRPYRKMIQAFYELLVAFDLLNAKVLLAKLLQANCPTLVQTEQKIHLVNAYHPVLYLTNKQQGQKTIPFQCHFDASNRIMVISGPNAGGKSITLKTIGLLQIMLQCGLFVTAHPKSEMCIIQHIVGDIGDNQSIEDGLSTYSSRLLKMKYFLQHADSSTLFLIDEFGTGSDPDMGGALAEVILNKLNEKQSIGVVTTHFTNLKLLANHQEGIFNACMLFNSKSLKPLYQLQLGEPGSSFTFEVANKTGLDKELIEAAKGKLSKEKVKMDKLLNQLQVEKNNLEKLKRDIQKQMSKTTAAKREYTELNEQLESSIQKHQEHKQEKQKLMEYGKKLHQLTQEWISNKNKKEVIAKFVKLAGYEQVKKKEQDEFEKSALYKERLLQNVKSKIAIGSKVKLLKSKEIGMVKSIKENRAIILFGKVEMNVGLEKLEVVS